MNTLSISLFTAVLAQTPPADAEVATQIQSIWDFILKGGPMMIPIGLCSLFALAVIVERLITLRRQNIIPPDFLSELKARLKGNDDDYSKAFKHCEANNSPLAGIFAVGIKRLSEPVERLEKQIQEAGERAVFKLRKHLRALSVIAAICPLMGLLGTIFGMIKAFQTVATSGEALGKTELLAEGIYQAMITTAAGLLVAIPVIIAYHWISSRIDHLVNEMDRLAVEFIEEHAVNRDSQSPSNYRFEANNESEQTERAVVATS